MEQYNNGTSTARGHQRYQEPILPSVIKKGVLTALALPFRSLVVKKKRKVSLQETS